MADGYGAAIAILFILVFLIIIAAAIGFFWFGLNRFEALGVTGISVSSTNSLSVLGNQIIILNSGPSGTNTLTLNSDSGNTTGKTFIINNMSNSTVTIQAGSGVSIQNAQNSSNTVVLSNKDSAQFVFNGTNVALFLGILHNT